jgi:hypothetical protein
MTFRDNRAVVTFFISEALTNVPNVSSFVL